MSQSTKTLARRRIRARAKRLDIRLPMPGRHIQRRNQTRGMEGFREASIAGVKLFSKPIDTAIETYHIGNGIYKMYRAIKRWVDRNV